MKNKIIIWVMWLLFIWLFIYSIAKSNEVSELNKQIDIQEKKIQEHCNICYEAQTELKTLYWDKKQSLSGLIMEK